MLSESLSDTITCRLISVAGIIDTTEMACIRGGFALAGKRGSDGKKYHLQGAHDVTASFLVAKDSRGLWE